MAGASLLTLLDDIATVLDDVAVMTKVAAKKTAGVLGDDLALNAQQVTGVRAERELPVVWAVAKGSFRNKLILVPAALLISFFIPWLITPLLLLGGLFLCFEGAEKIIHSLFHPKEHSAKPDPEPWQGDLADYEQTKIKGAIRTDFILSAEIIVIALGTVQDQVMLTKVFVVSLIALVMTVGVYGLVAMIVKMDDLGFYWLDRYQQGQILHRCGLGLVGFAPYLMKSLAVIGTIAMFLVGGGIVTHSISAIHHWLEPILATWAHLPLVVAVLPTLFNGVVGIFAGCVIVALVQVYQKLFKG
ncbi:DUF808 domain-containing protein [Motilimonas sp. KMU-193]|uniref:DUF808 domain-containing protein n=1 Tax=Motilimonas sp. KMU-193 TaxID=3388668 RepID=UPI00396B2879